MRIACIRINNLPIQVALCGDPNLRGQPLVVGGLPFELKAVYDASPEAMAYGVRTGMPLRQAQALCPEATFLPVEEKRCEETFEKVVNALENFSPVVDVGEPGCGYIDVTGVPDEEELASNIVDTISAETELTPCAGVSNGKFLSRTAALTSRPGVPIIVPQGEEKDFVTPFSIDFLPCSKETRERLHLLGIHFVGHLSRFSCEALVAQFGREGGMLHELCHGIDRSPLIPRNKPEIIVVAVDLQSSATIDLQILHACQVILKRPLERVKAQGKVCRQTQVKAFFASGISQERRLLFREPTVSISVILNRLRTWLETVTFPAPVTRVELSLSLTKETGKSLHLWPEHQRMGKLPIGLANELRVRFGYQPLKKIEVVDPNAILPERRFRVADILEQETEDG